VMCQKWQYSQGEEMVNAATHGRGIPDPVLQC
jgi:hypothetical protein